MELAVPGWFCTMELAVLGWLCTMELAVPGWLCTMELAVLGVALYNGISCTGSGFVQWN